MVKTLLTTISIAAILTVSALAAEWKYDGDTGPEKWASLSTNFAACEGNEQSPVNLSGGMKAALPKMTITQGYLTGKFENNGHTLQLTAGLDVPALQIDETPYNLLQMHFHGLSEHAINGKRSPMELHYVYQDEDGGLAVIGVMVNEGAENPELAKLFASLPAGSKSADVRNIDMSALMPNLSSGKNGANAAIPYYRYRGSLTTPPCSEIVTWTVMKDAITASASQIDTFGELFPNNARPLQSLNRRYLLQSF